MINAVEFIDTHVHLDAQDFDADRSEVIERARLAGVRRFVSIGAGSGFESAARAAQLAATHPFIWASAGIHPHDAQIDFNISALEIAAKRPRVVAIGETGLDYHYDFAPKAKQQEWFEAQIHLARKVQLPLIIHCRKAAEDCLETLTRLQARDVGGVFHCFSEDAAFARKLADINFMVSFPGIVTFKNSQSTRDAARDIPLDRIMLETDAPYLAPVPHRGQRCESSFLPKTAEVIAAVRGLSVEDLATATTRNAVNFFKLSGA